MSAPIVFKMLDLELNLIASGMYHEEQQLNDWINSVWLDAKYIVANPFLLTATAYDSRQRPISEFRADDLTNQPLRLDYGDLKQLTTQH